MNLSKIFITVILSLLSSNILASDVANIQLILSNSRFVKGDKVVKSINLVGKEQNGNGVVSRYSLENERCVHLIDVLNRPGRKVKGKGIPKDEVRILKSSSLCKDNEEVVKNSSEPEKVKVESEVVRGEYRGYFRSGHLFIITKDTIQADALSNCKLNDSLNPSLGGVRCTFNGQEIFKSY